MTSPILVRKRPFALAVAVLGLLASYFVVTMTRADAAEVVVSQGKPATASSSEVAGAYLASEGNDGNNGTRWASTWSAAQWWQVDLGTATAVSRIAINWES